MTVFLLDEMTGMPDMATESARRVHSSEGTSAIERSATSPSGSPAGEAAAVA